MIQNKNIQISFSVEYRINLKNRWHKESWWEKLFKRLFEKIENQLVNIWYADEINTDKIVKLRYPLNVEDTSNILFCQNHAINSSNIFISITWTIKIFFTYLYYNSIDFFATPFQYANKIYVHLTRCLQ